MAVVKNASFAGASIYEVDPGALTLTSTLKNVQGDVAAVLERVTDKTIALDIDHSGPGRGCPLGIPVVDQLVIKSTLLGTGFNKNGDADDDRLQFPWFVLVPPGETEMVVDVTFGGTGYDDSVLAPQCRLSTVTSFTSAVGDDLDVDMQLRSVRPSVDLNGRAPGGKRPGLTRYRARFTGLTSGIALLTVSFSQYSAIVGSGANEVRSSAFLHHVGARFGRGPAPALPADARSSTNDAPVQAPASTQALFFQQMDAALFTKDEAITGFHTSRIDANINGLAENLTGAPAWKNATYTHTESALLNPTRDRFRAFTRKTFANEPIPKIPVCSHNFGGIKETGYYLVDPATPASVSARRAFAPYASSSASAELGSGRARCPDIPSGTMRWAILVGQSPSSGAGFANVRAQAQMGAAAASALVTPTALTGAAHLAVAQGTGLAFTRDSSSNRLRAFLSQAAGVFDSLNYCLITAAVWIEE